MRRAASRPAILAILLFGLLLALTLKAQAGFWESYQEGVRANEAGDYAKAARLLEEAVAQRPDPAKRVRLYGTNFVNDYYPYTQLGLAYLKLGQAEKGQAALQKALSSGIEPRERVEALLQQVRAAARSPEAPPKKTIPPPPATGAQAPAPSQPPAASAAQPSAPLPASAGALPEPAAPRPAVVQFTSVPSGASVTLDQRTVGKTPLTFILPGEGQHLARFEKAGYAPQDKTFSLRPGDRLTIPAELAPPGKAGASPSRTPTTGELDVLVRPMGAAISLDGAQRGTATAQPLVLLGLAPGSHTLSLTALGYEPKRVEINVQSGVRSSFQTDLSPVPTSATGPSEPAPPGLPVWIWPVGGAAAILLVAALVYAFRKKGGPPASVTGTGGERPSILADESAGASLGHYAIRSKLGSGGMADVYLAEDERTGQQVALKVPLSRFCQDEAFTNRFLREGRIGQSLSHDGIIRILETGQADGRLFIAMEYVVGDNLKAVLARLTCPFTPRETARLIKAVALILEYTHGQGVIHRDLKPENIMVLKGSHEVKVADFGVAKLVDATSFTTTGQVLGTPNYLPPEPFIGEPYGRSSDLYSLGVIFFEMLTLVKPFEADTLIETLRRHQALERPRPSSANPLVPPALDAIVLKLLQIRPADRYQSASELVATLDSALAVLRPSDETLLLSPE